MWVFILRLDPGVLAILAQVEPPQWLNWGVLGAVVLAIVTGQLVPGPTHKRLLAENDSMRAEIRSMSEKQLEQAMTVIPALREAQQALSQSAEEIRLLRGRRVR